MPAPATSIFEQLRRNAVAIISLVVALSSLSYNTWRNERSEENRNQRFAAFEVILKLGELQQLVFHNHYDDDVQGKGNLRTGWAYVLTIRDLSTVLAEPMPASAGSLLATWEANSELLHDRKENLDAVLSGIESTRDDTLQLLQSLD